MQIKALKKKLGWIPIKTMAKNSNNPNNGLKSIFTRFPKKVN